MMIIMMMMMMMMEARYDPEINMASEGAHLRRLFLKRTGLTTRTGHPRCHITLSGQLHILRTLSP